MYLKTDIDPSDYSQVDDDHYEFQDLDLSNDIKIKMSVGNFFIPTTKKFSPVQDYVDGPVDIFNSETGEFKKIQGALLGHVEMYEPFKLAIETDTIELGRGHWMFFTRADKKDGVVICRVLSPISEQGLEEN